MFENLGKSLKGLIMEDEGPSGNQPTGPSVTAGVAIPSSQLAPVNNEFVEALRTVIKNRPTALTALTTAAEKLVAVIPDSNMRMKAAFQMVKSEGRGVKELLDAITVHAADLESQKLQFNRALEAESQKSIGQQQTALDNLTNSTSSCSNQIATLQAQIKSLNELIVQNNSQAAVVTQQISSEKARLAQNAQQFDTALLVVKNELDTQRSVIQSTLS